MNESDKIILFSNGVRAYRFETLNNDHVSSLFTTRIGGISPDFYGTLNLGCSTGDSTENVLENFRRVAACIGTDADRIVTGAQTHTKNIRIVTEEDAGKGVTRPKDYENIDGLITNVKGLCLCTSHADCNPVQLYDPVMGVIAAVHSGWKGTLLNISVEAVKMMRENFGCAPGNMRAAIGPALCRDCFEVDTDVAEMFIREYPYLAAQKEICRRADLTREITKYYIDLKKIIVRQLTEAGVPADHIEVSALCTKEHPELFYSHRKTGVKRGVMGSMIMMTGH